MLRDNRLYRTWCGMKKRCYNPNAKDYKYYGGKGVTVCDEWLHDFNAFESWSNTNGYSDDLTIDRINTNGNYCPDNCRWISLAEQQLNRTSTIHIECNGQLKTISEISKEFGIEYRLIYSRYKSAIKHKGRCDISDVLKTPSHPRTYTEKYKNRRRKASTIVCQYTLEGIYIDTFSLLEAEKRGFNRRAIHNCCAGRSRSSSGYVWEYLKT